MWGSYRSTSNQEIVLNISHMVSLSFFRSPLSDVNATVKEGRRASDSNIDSIMLVTNRELLFDSLPAYLTKRSRTSSSFTSTVVSYSFSNFPALGRSEERRVGKECR